jgi:hypothetical protein
MIKIRIQGFQSIEDVSLEVEGFSALVGRSNIGKSAVVRAVRCAMTNALGTAFVRHRVDCSGKKKCDCFTSVSIQAEGLDLLWEKGDNVNHYLINGEPYDKPGPGMPTFLDACGFGLLPVGEDKVSLQVSDQYHPLFLLNRSGPLIAGIISDVAKLDRINTATKLVEKDRKESVATRKVREKDIAVLEKDLEGYASLDAVQLQIARADRTQLLLKDTAHRAQELAAFDRELDRLQGEVARFEALAKVKIPDVVKLQAKFELTQRLFRLASELGPKAREFKRLEVLSEKLSDLPTPPRLVRVLESAQLLAGWVGRLRRFKVQLPQLTQMSLVEVPAHDELAAKVADVGRLKPKLSKAEKLRAEIQRLEQREKELQASSDEFQQEIDTLQQEIDALGVCPTCGNPTQERHNHAETFVSL